MNFYEKRRKLNFIFDKVKKSEFTTEEILTHLRRNADDIKAFAIRENFNNPLYRARCNKEIGFKLFSNVSELKHPPEHKVKKRGRCNEIGESMLYASTSELGAITELVNMGLGLNSLFTVAILERIYDVVAFIPVGTSHHKDQTLSKYDRLFHKMCFEELSKKALQDQDNQDAYNFSIALTKFYLRTGVMLEKENKKSDIDLALVYPSVHSGSITNKTVYNVAMTPETFERAYKVSKIVCYVIIHEKENDQLILTPVNNAKVNYSKGDLEWIYSYDEMKERVLSGRGIEKINSPYIKDKATEILSLG